jgi:activator of HSP90 ATPase
MGNHMSDIKLEVLNLPCGKKDMYVDILQMSWLAQHNPDIDWTKGSMRWRSTYCKEHCLPKTIQIQLINEKQLLQENAEDIHLFGMAVYHDKDGRV